MTGAAARFLRLRVVRVLLVCLVALTVAAAASGASRLAAGPSATYVLSAEYKGTYHFEDHQSFGGASLDSVETFKWDALGTQTVRGDTGAVLSSTFSLKASGRLYQNSTNGGKPRIEDCTFSALPAAQLKSMDTIVNIQAHVVGRLTGFGAGLQMPDTTGQQVSVTDKNGNCNMGTGSSVLLNNSASAGTVGSVTWLPQPQTAAWLEAFGSPALNVLLGRTLTQPIDTDQTGQGPNETAKRSVHGVWILGGPVGSPGPTTPAKPPAKKPCTPTSGTSTPLDQATASEYLRKLASWIERYGNALQARIPYLPPDWQKFAKDELDYKCSVWFRPNLLFQPYYGRQPPFPDPPNDDSFRGVDVTSSPDVVSASSGKPGARSSTTIGFTKAGIAALAAGKPLTVALNGVFRLKNKPPITATATITFKGRPATTTPSISSVTVTGTPQNPSLVVQGTNLGVKPAPNPAGSPANRPLCPVKIVGNAGLDYGTSLYLDDTTANWAAGRYRPAANELDCIGLIVTSFTPTRVAFRLGSAYQQFYPKYQLNNGDQAQITINGAMITVHLKYGTPVSN